MVVLVPEGVSSMIVMGMHYSDRQLIPVLKQYAGQRVTARDLSIACAMPYSTLRRHLHILERSGVITIRRFGRRWGMLIDVK